MINLADMKTRNLALAVAILLSTACGGTTSELRSDPQIAQTQAPVNANAEQQPIPITQSLPPAPPSPPAPPPNLAGTCNSGFANDLSNNPGVGFACAGINLRARVDLASMSGDFGNDLWGWADSRDDREYALMGMNTGVSFVEVTNPDAPLVIGRMPTPAVDSPVRDIKVQGNYAYVVADNAGNHGMQVFDLTRLQNAGSNNIFTPDFVYGDFEEAHNLAVNTSSGYTYALGSNTCSGGLHIIDTRTAQAPLFVNCYDADGYTHDSQCVNYNGGDASYVGREICFNFNETEIAIVDVTDKQSLRTISTAVYPNFGYVHQGWLSEDQRHLLVDDEFDEPVSGINTRTLVFDVADLDNPRLLYEHSATTTASDHNQYVLGNEVFQANYTAGLRILRFDTLATDTLTEVAFFDTRPETDAAVFEGAWSVYPFLPSGTILISDINRGLFVVTRQ